MSGPRRALAVQLGLVLVLLAAFSLAELARYTDPVHGTVMSMAGWVAFAALFLLWLWEDCGLRVGLRRLARLAVLTLVAFGVLYLYYRRSQLLDIGIEVDATFTYLGVEWFTALDNPITFAGRTTSFAQFPMALLTHLPAHLFVGFDRLGPFAIHVGIMLQVAMLLALLTTFFVESRLIVQTVVVAFAAAVFSNRLTVLVYNLTGYAIPALSIGFIFLVTTLGDRRPSVVMPRVGGLLMLSLMHHYPGFFFVVPLVLLWVVAGWTPWRRLVTFVRANIPLCAAALMLVSCVVIHPEMLLNRIRAVTMPSLVFEEFRAKILGNWAFLTGPFRSVVVRTFFHDSPGSWHLLNVPPLGGYLPYIVCANWVVTAVAMGWRGPVYVLRLAVLCACLVVLTALQHLVTGFENYRDMTIVLGMMMSGLGFVFLIPRVRPALRVFLTAYALAASAYCYADIAVIAGKHYGVREYASDSQATTENLRRFWRRDERLRGAIVHTVIGPSFPLGLVYKAAAQRHGIELRFLEYDDFCRDPSAVVARALGTTCGRRAFVVPATACPQAWTAPLGWPAPPASGVALYVLEAPCGRRPPLAWSAPQVVDLP